VDTSQHHHRHKDVASNGHGQNGDNIQHSNGNSHHETHMHDTSSQSPYHHGGSSGGPHQLPLLTLGQPLLTPSLISSQINTSSMSSLPSSMRVLSDEQVRHGWRALDRPLSCTIVHSVVSSFHHMYM
jgi:hypothetical protein